MKKQDIVERYFGGDSRMFNLSKKKLAKDTPVEEDKSAVIASFREEPGYRMTLEDRAKLQHQLDEYKVIGNGYKKETMACENEIAKIKED